MAEVMWATVFTNVLLFSIMDIKYLKDSKRMKHCGRPILHSQRILHSPTYLDTNHPRSKSKFRCGRDIVGRPWHHVVNTPYTLDLNPSVPLLLFHYLTQHKWEIKLSVLVLDTTLAFGIDK